MKILSGKYKGRTLHTPVGIRPIQEVAKKSLFDTLGQDLEGVSFLDLFAGSGSVGLEALSRGAKEVVFVEEKPYCCEVIKKNLVLLRIPEGENTKIITMDVFESINLLETQDRKFDIIFADPPYGEESAKKALKCLEACAILTPNSLVIIKHDKKEILKTTTLGVCFKQKRFGGTLLSFYQGNFLEKFSKP